MNLKIKKLHPNAVVPQYATAGAACFDLHAINVPSGALFVDREDYGPNTFDTGLAFEVPTGHVMLVFSRSGHGFKHDVRLANCVGVIDADYRGEVKVKLTSDASLGQMLVQEGDRIAQAMVLPVRQVAFEVVEEIGDTARGAGGFGSTGT